MAPRTVIQRAVHAARAYFQREWNDQIMNFDQIPPSAFPVIIEVYVLLTVVSTSVAVVSYVSVVTVLFGIDSQSLLDAPWEMALGFYWFWIALFRMGSFSFFHCFSDVLVISTTAEWIASIVSHYSPFFTWEMCAPTACFVLYVTAYSQMMVRRIVEKGEMSLVKHAICIFTEFPYVSYHIARTSLERITRGWRRAPQL